MVEALEMLLEDNLLLDFMDSKCSCNIIEYLLNDWTKQHLVNDAHVKHFAAQREEVSMLLQKRETGNHMQPSIINFIIRAEVPLSGILKTLSADYNKVQEALLGVLCQVLVGTLQEKKSFPFSFIICIKFNFSIRQQFRFNTICSYRRRTFENFCLPFNTM